MGSTPKYPSYNDDTTYWVTGKTLNAIFKAIKETTPLEGKNVRLRQKADGIQIDAEGGGGGESYTHPYLCEIVGAGVTVAPGLYNGETPLIGGVPMDTLPAPVLGMSLLGTERPRLKLEYDLTEEDGYVFGAELVDVSIEVSSGGGLLTSSDGIFYYPLATFIDGVKTAQTVISSLSGTVCDSGHGDGSATLTIMAA